MTVTAHVFPQFQQGLASSCRTWRRHIYCALSNAAGPVTLATSGVQAAKLWTDWKTNVAAEITGTGLHGGRRAADGREQHGDGQRVDADGDVAVLGVDTITANQAIFYDGRRALSS